MKTEISKLACLIKQFIDGEDTSISLANEIEVALDDMFPDVDAIQDTVLMLASYRPGGGPYLYSEQEVMNQLQKTLKLLS
jgi:hypothetical protein